MRGLSVKIMSAILSLAVICAFVPPFAASADETRTLWDFAEYESSPVTATNKIFENYDGMEIHLASGDTITSGGIVWSAPCGTASSDANVAGDNRYIKFTPDKAGTLTVKFSGNKYGSSSKAPRMYVINGDAATASFSKNGSDKGTSATATAADKETTLTAELDADTTYYIWSYYYNDSSVTFTVSEISYTAAVPEMKTRNIYESNMLLQRDEPVYIDGTCSAVVETATAKLYSSEDNYTSPVQTKDITVNGREWNVTFDAVSDYEKTYKIVFSTDGMEDIVYENILFGDQYIFSGQSNMWMKVSDYASIDKDAYSQSAVTPHLTDKIRLMYTPGQSDYGTNVLQYDAQNKKPWRDFSTYSNVQEVGAPAYTAAVKLYEETGVPIGVIDNPYPGSYISSWFDSALKIDNCNTGKNSTSNERNWYCGRIYPLRNLKLSGIFWYQGEADAATTYHDNPYEYYSEMLPRLISSWRELFNDSDLPFYYTQLSRIGSTIVDENNPDTGSAGKMPIKLAQTDVYLNMQDKTNVGIVSTLDLYGNHDASGSRNCRTDIHLAQKQYVGDRMANLALVDIYNKSKDKDNNTIYRMGPLYKSNELRANGSVAVTFDCHGQLKIMPSSQYTDTTGEEKIENGEINPNILNEFEIQDANGWHTATAVIEGADKVVLSAVGVTLPTAVRYCGSDYPESPNLTDESGLPSYVFTASVESDSTPTDPTDANTVKYIFGTDTASEGVIPVNTDTAYGTHNGKRYGLIDIDESSIQNDFHFDGFTDDVLTYPKSGTAGGDTYITADYSKYDAETLATFGDGVIPVRFAAAGESGAYYTVKATVVNAGDSEEEVSLFGENRYMILYNHKLAAGEKITKTWNVRLVGQYYSATGEYADDAINVVVSGKNAGLVSVEITKHDTIGKTMWLMTDSTGDNSSAALPYFGLRGKAGDGQVFTKYINPEIAINNQGEGGLKSSDTNHFNNALKYMQSGDYLYVQYGFNGETADSLKANLPRYYNAAKEKGATLIVASTSERQSSSFWDSTNYVWKGSNASITAAGKEYVDGVLEADPTAKIAFVDLNTNIIDWMTTETARISTLRGEANPNRLTMNYYFGYDRDSGVDSIHINDAGADNAAYIVYTEMKKNALLNELTSNNSTETPYLVSTDIIQKGWTPNDSYPLPLPSDVTYEYPTIVKGIEYGEAYNPNEEIDKITAAYKADGSLDTVNISKIKASQVEEASNTATQKVFYWKSLESMEPYTRTEGTAVDSIQVMVQGNMQYYAIGAVDILDAEGNVIKTAYSKSTDKNAEINHIDNVASQYGEVYTMYFDKSETVIADGQSVRAYTVAVETGEAPTDEKYSSYYIPYETETTLLDESFSEGISGWSEGGSGSKETSYAEKDGRKAIKLSTTGNGTYNVVKRFDDNAEVSNGILKLHFMINYSYGNMTFKLTPAAATGSYVAGEKTLNIIDGALQFADGTEIGKLKNGKWTDIDCTIDFIAGTQTASVAGGTPKTVSIDALKSENAADITDYAPIRSFAVTYMSTGSTIPAYSFEMYLADVTAETIKTTLPQYTINAAAADGQSEYGSVTGGGEYDVNSNAEIKATAKTGYEFDGWYDENGNKVSGKSTYSVRVRDNKTLYAKFVQEVIDPNVTKWSFSEYAGKAVNATSSTSEAYTKNGETLNIYLGNGDSITEEGLYWGAAATRGETDTPQSRYMTFTPTSNGTLTVTFVGSMFESNRKPRMYIIEGTSTADAYKSNSDASKGMAEQTAANSVTTLTKTLEAGKTYYIWTYYYYSSLTCPFTISSITYDTSAN